MKNSEFYEKYWLVDGKPVPPLREVDKEYLDGTLIDFAAPKDFYDSPPLSDITIDEYPMWHNPTKEELMKVYQKIIDQNLSFTHVLKVGL